MWSDLIFFWEDAGVSLQWAVTNAADTRKFIFVHSTHSSRAPGGAARVNLSLLSSPAAPIRFRLWYILCWVRKMCGLMACVIAQMISYICRVALRTNQRWISFAEKSLIRNAFSAFANQICAWLMILTRKTSFATKTKYVQNFCLNLAHVFFYVRVLGDWQNLLHFFIDSREK